MRFRGPKTAETKREVVLECTESKHEQKVCFERDKKQGRGSEILVDKSRVTRDVIRE